MKISLSKDNSVKEVVFKGQLRDLLTKLGINPEEVIIARNNELLTLEEEVHDNESIRIIPVLSGG